MARTFEQLRPVLHRVFYGNQTVPNASKDISLARFALCFVTQPNGPKCTKIVWNAMKHEFWVQWGGLGAFIAKNSDTTSWHELLHHFGQFCTEFCTATKRSQMHPKVYETHQNVSLEATGVDRVRSLRKIPTRLRGMNFCTRLDHFALSVVTWPNSPKCTQIVRNAPKHKFSVQWVDRMVCCEKFRHDFMARTFAPLHAVLHPVL